MSQQTIQPTAEVASTTAIPSEKRSFPQMILLPEEAIERLATGWKTITTPIERIIASWRALPAEKRRFIALAGFSVYLAATTSVIATLIARLVQKKTGDE
ncbi:MAG TPA: hypothetical protein VFQ30_08730 [Ktedonobacteraceae bacterium]|nr:hypothetical protein [Ktedonobacteraceae bacterium]